MSLPIVDDEDDEDGPGDDNSIAVQRTILPKSPPLSNKLPIVHSGEEDCYYCGKVFEKSKMKRITMAGLPAYKCERC